jgi:autotransporter-associated beta strand protein
MRTMKIIWAGLVLAVLMAGASAQAVSTNWWDINGATPGSGAGTDGSGSWTNTLWTTDSAGSSATTVWTPGAVAVFSAGTDGTAGTIGITITGTQNVNGLLKEEGGVNRPVFYNGVLNFVGANPFIQGDMGFQGVTVIQGTNTLTLGGSGNFQVGTMDLLKDAPGGQLSIKIKDSNTWNWKYTNTSFTGGTTLGAGSTLNWGANPGASLTNPDNGIVDAFGDGAITMEAGSTFASVRPSGSVSNSWRTVTNAFILSGDVVIQPLGGTQSSNGFNSLTLSGPVTLTADRKISVNTAANIGTATNNTTEIAGAVGGNYKLTKGGVGLLVLSGTNTYTGGTIVSNGALAVNGKILGPITVDAGATLLGNGTIDGAATVNGRLNSTNYSIGKLTFNTTLNLGSASTTTVRIVSSGSFSVLANDGGDAITISNGATIVFDTTGYTAQDGDRFTVLSNWVGRVGTLANITFVGTDLGNGKTLDTAGFLSHGIVSVGPFVTQKNLKLLILH